MKRDLTADLKDYLTTCRSKGISSDKIMGCASTLRKEYATARYCEKLVGSVESDKGTYQDDMKSAESCGRQLYSDYGLLFPERWQRAPDSGDWEYLEREGFLIGECYPLMMRSWQVWERAAHCSEDKDCVLLMNRWEHIGCQVMVNKKDITGINAIRKLHLETQEVFANNRCHYIEEADCPNRVGSLTCVDGYCQSSYLGKDKTVSRRLWTRRLKEIEEEKQRQLNAKSSDIKSPTGSCSE